MTKRFFKKGQEEIVGFAMIIIIVSVILLIFLGFSLSSSNKESVESYEVSSFIQSFLQYTTDCRDNLEYLSIQKLIFSCYSNERCLDERSSCDVLNSTLKNLVSTTWKIEGDRPVKGYELDIVTGNSSIRIHQGNVTQSYKGAMQNFARAGESYDVFFKVYY
jgi:hypothetical protein